MKSLAARTKAAAGTCAVILDDDVAAVVAYLRGKGYSAFDAWSIALDAVVPKRDTSAARATASGRAAAASATGRRRRMKI